MTVRARRRVGRELLRPVAVAVLLALVGAAPAAAAGTVALVDEPNPVNRTLQFTAGVGDTNAVTVVQAGAVFTVTDTGATIATTDPACTGAGTNTVVCTDATITQIGAALGDGNDAIRNDTASGSDFDGGDGNDTLLGGTGDDPTILGGTGDDTIDGRAGDDGRGLGLAGGLGSDRITGGDGNDTLRGSDVGMSAGDGGNVLDAGAGVDLVFGGDGADTVLGGAGVDTLDGGPGADAVSGGGGDDRMQESRDDVTDELDGDSGDDSFQLASFPFPPAQGNDLMNGGPGFDRVTVTDFTFVFFGAPNAPVRLTLGDFAANDGFEGQALDLLSIEDADIGSPGGSDDFVRGTPDANRLETFDGSDDVDGGAGPDAIALGAGDDTVEARDGFQDRIDCGDGIDTANVDQVDVVSGCERLTTTFVQPAGTSPLPPAAAPADAPPPPPPPPPPADVAADTTAPVCSISVASTLRRLDRGIAVGSSCDEPVSLRIRLAVTIRRATGAGAAAAGELTLAERSFSSPLAARTARLPIPRRLRRSLGRRATLRLRIEATDAAGNRRTISKAIHYRRSS